MAGLDPAIFSGTVRVEMAGSSPAMTISRTELQQFWALPRAFNPINNSRCLIPLSRRRTRPTVVQRNTVHPAGKPMPILTDGHPRVLRTEPGREIGDRRRQSGRRTWYRSVTRSSATRFISTIDEKPKRTGVPLKRLRNITENPEVAVTVDRWTRTGAGSPGSCCAAVPKF